MCVSKGQADTSKLKVLVDLGSIHQNHPDKFEIMGSKSDPFVKVVRQLTSGAPESRWTLHSRIQAYAAGEYCACLDDHLVLECLSLAMIQSCTSTRD